MWHPGRCVKRRYNNYVNNETLTRLLDLNKQFYQTFGREFSSTRQRLQPGVIRILDMLGGDEVLLDLGCGNGQLARELLQARSSGCLHRPRSQPAAA